jgi:hypothetical protein
MAISHFFNGKIYKLPGAYAMTTANVGTASTATSYGDVLIIDTGSNAGYAGGAGITGTTSQGSDNIYHFRNDGEMRNFFKAGPWYSNAARLFNPSTSSSGVSSVYYVSARETVAPTFEVPYGSSTDVITITLRDEGEWANGVIVGGKLSKGYKASLAAGTRDASKFQLVISVSTFSGVRTEDGIPYNEMEQKDCSDSVVIVSPEVATVEELKSWADRDATFNAGFVWTSGTSGTFEAANIGEVLATGGTEAYSLTHLDQVFEAAKDLNVSFILCDKYGSNAPSAINTAVVGFAKNQRFDTITFVAANSSKGDFSASISAAKYFNSDYVCVVHGGYKGPSGVTYNKLRDWGALEHTCLVLGRIAGLAPQLPPTFKEITVSGLTHNLTAYEKEDALDAGLLTTYYDQDMQATVILKGVNSLQNNNLLVNPDGSSPMISIRRVAAQVNKELIIDSKAELLTQKNGVTIVTLPEAVVLSWVNTKLGQKAGRGLISKFQNVQIERQQDAYFVSYEFQPAYEINFIFFTGVIID